MVSTLTYEALYEILRKEKIGPEIQPLSKDFFSNLVAYLDEKTALLSGHDDLQNSQKSMTQLQNIKKMIKEIYERRENKIFQLALFASRTKEKPDLSPLLPEEKELYKDFHDTLDKFRKGILHNIMNSKNPELEKAKPLKTAQEQANESRRIRMLHAIPKFVGDDQQIYGPFEPEDVASLPPRVAEILIEKRRAESL